MEPFCVAIDLGGTAIKSAVVSKSGKLEHFSSIDTQAEKGPGFIIRTLSEIIISKLSNIGDKIHWDNFEGVGIGMPGVVGLDSNTVSELSNFPNWNKIELGTKLKEILEAHYNKPIRVLVENDANLAALGESQYGAGKAYKDFLMITLGTGVGCGIIINNNIYKGATGAAGELGHISIQFQSENIHADILGSLESYVGQRQISAYAKQTLQNSPGSILNDMLAGNIEQLEPKHLTEAAQKGDAFALRIWQEIGSFLGVGLASTVSILDIRKIVIGGGVAGAREFLFPATLNQLKKYSITSFHKDLQLIPAILGNDAGLFGAAARVFQE